MTSVMLGRRELGKDGIGTAAGEVEAAADRVKRSSDRMSVKTPLFPFFLWSGDGAWCDDGVPDAVDMVCGAEGGID